MADDAPAGIARDSCPFCGERVKVPAWILMMSGRRAMTVTCAACGETSQIAGRTRIAGGLTGTGVMLAIIFGLFGHIDKGSLILMGMTGYCIASYFVGRLTLRLDPPQFGD